MNQTNQDPKEKLEAADTDRTKNDQPAAEVEKKLLHHARQHTNIILVVCCVLFLSIYLLVNISSVAGIFSAIFSVFTPILLGAALAYLLNPLLKLYEHKVFHKLKSKKLLRALSMLMTYVTAILIVIALAFLLIPQLIDTIVDFISNFNLYMENTSVLINNFLSKIIGNDTELVDREMIVSFIQSFLLKSGDALSDIAGYVLQYGTGLVVGIKNLLLAIFISIYILSSKERLKAQTNKLVTALCSRKSKRKFYKYLYLCNRTFSRYFIGMLLDSLIVGVITFIFLCIFGIPYELLIASIVCVTNIIPIFGPFIGAIPSFLIIFIVDPPKALIFLIIVLVVQQIDGNVIAPKIHGNSTGLSSLGVIIAIIVMGEYFGLVGMIIGVPVCAVVVSAFTEFLDGKLIRKRRPTATAEYYENDSLVDPHEQNETLFLKLAHHFGPKAHAKAKTRHEQKQAKKKNAKINKDNQDKNEKEL